MGESLEVARCVGLSQAGGQEQLGNAFLARLKRLNQLEPTGPAQSTEPGGNMFEGLVGQGVEGTGFGHEINQLHFLLAF